MKRPPSVLDHHAIRNAAVLSGNTAVDPVADLAALEGELAKLAERCRNGCARRRNGARLARRASRSR